MVVFPAFAVLSLSNSSSSPLGSSAELGSSMATNFILGERRRINVRDLSGIGGKKNYWRVRRSSKALTQQHVASPLLIGFKSFLKGKKLDTHTRYLCW